MTVDKDLLATINEIFKPLVAAEIDRLMQEAIEDNASWKIENAEQYGGPDR